MLSDNTNLRKELDKIINTEMVYIESAFQDIYNIKPSMLTSDVVETVTAIEHNIEEVYRKVVDKILDLLKEHRICPECLDKLLIIKRKVDVNQIVTTGKCDNCGFEYIK